MAMLKVYWLGKFWMFGSNHSVLLFFFVVRARGPWCPHAMAGAVNISATASLKKF
jgi:hypothetical protein